MWFCKCLCFYESCAESVTASSSFLRLSAVVNKSKVCEDFAKSAEISGIVPSSW
jgi:hypothetical protein